MHYFWIITWALLLVGCAQKEFVATPNPDEISSITYQVNTPQGSQAWNFINNNLSLTYSRRDIRGRIILAQTKKITPNDFNWLVTEVEKTNYKKINSPSTLTRSSYVWGQKRPPLAPEIFTIESLGGTYAFQGGGNIKLPAGLEILAKKIPSIFK